MKADGSRRTTIAKIEITITDPADIFVSQEVEGSIVEALPVLPERIERRRQTLAELAQLAQDDGIYD